MTSSFSHLRQKTHLKHLHTVVGKLMEAGLKFKLSKCHFARAAMKYLGFLVTSAGLKPTTLHIKAVEEFPFSTSLK